MRTIKFFMSKIETSLSTVRNKAMWNPQCEYNGPEAQRVLYWPIIEQKHSLSRTSQIEETSRILLNKTSLNFLHYM